MNKKHRKLELPMSRPTEAFGLIGWLYHLLFIDNIQNKISENPDYNLMDNLPNYIHN
jgi:hypothetical protein